MPFTQTECLKAREDFPSLSRTVEGWSAAFLDGPAGTQVPRPVIDAISGYYQTCNSNSHGAFITSQETDRIVEDSRAAVAAFINAPSGQEISFGANMTTLNFCLSHALVRSMQSGDEILITQLDHEANRGPWLLLADQGIVIKEIALRPDGTLDEADLEAKIGARTRLVAMGLSSNALGTVNDVKLARRLTQELGAWLLLDAVHYAPHFSLDVAMLQPDFLLCSAYKFYGPHVGILYTRSGLLEQLRVDKLRTQRDTAPERIETGTLNFAAIAGVKAAVEYIASWGQGPNLRRRLVEAMEGIATYESALAQHYWLEVRQIPGVTVWGPGFTNGERAPTVSITIDGLSPREAATELAGRGIFLWDGDFYAIRAMEVLGLAKTGGVLRTGISLYNTQMEIDRLLNGLEELVRIRQRP